MLPVFALFFLLTAAAAQKTFNCDTSGRDSIRQPDFYLVTRRANETSFPPGLNCKFQAESDSAAFLVEIQSFLAKNAALTIISGDKVLFRGSGAQPHETSITTPSKSLLVRFQALDGGDSNSTGATLRVRSLDKNGCPPQWTYLYGNCFGSSNTSARLDFVTAQKACNSMRSNLMQLPATYNGSIRSLVKLLPRDFTYSYAWIGLTDRAEQFAYYWLNGKRVLLTSEFSCPNGCISSDRCGKIYEDLHASGVSMGSCSHASTFLCSMPPWGTREFYPVPDADTTTDSPHLEIMRIVAAVTAGLTLVGATLCFVVHLRT